MPAILMGNARFIADNRPKNALILRFLSALAIASRAW